MSKRITIIGAGPGGLAAALLLRHAGLEVTILERLDRVGGRTSALEKDGFRFDRGPTFFLNPRILSEIFSTIGRDLYHDVPMVRLEPQCRMLFGGEGSLDTTSDIARMQQEIARLSPADAARLPQFLAENKQKLESLTPMLAHEFGSWTRFLAPEVLRALPLLRPWRCLETDLKKFFKDPRVRMAFSFPSQHLGMSPVQTPSLFTTLSYLDYDCGVFHPLGGCARLSEKMAEIAQEMGVEIRLGEEVQEILFSRKRAVGLVTDQKRYTFDALVINADFAQALTRLVPEDIRPRWSDQKIATKKHSGSTFMLYLGVEGSVPAAHHTVYFSPQTDQTEVSADGALSEDPSFYLANPCLNDPSMAPAGKSSLYLLIPVPSVHERINWNQETMRYREIAYRQLGRIGLGDLQERLLFEKIVTPQDWAEQMELYRGATNGMSFTWSQMWHWRPQNRFKDLGGVYLVGAGTHPGGGLPMIYASARISSELICQDLGV